MQIALSKNCDVPLRQQLAEQIVFLIRTGQLLAGQELPSVRAVAKQGKVHHNTVSDASQELVRRGWVTRSHESRLVVGKSSGAPFDGPHNLDELINEYHPACQGHGLHAASAATTCTGAALGSAT